MRDALFPACVYALVVHADTAHERAVAAISAIALLLAMLVGGHRMSVIVFAWVLGAACVVRWRARVGTMLSRRAVLTWVTAVMLFLSVFFGLNSLLDRARTPLSSLWINDFVLEIVDRIIAVVPRENAKYFVDVLQKEYAIGQLWWEDMLTLLPGKDIGLSNTLSGIHGSIEGDVVLATPMMCFINAGLAGVFIVPLITVIVLTLVEAIGLRTRSAFVDGAHQVLCVGLLVAYDVKQFLLNGGLVYLVVLSVVIWLRWSRGRRFEF